MSKSTATHIGRALVISYEETITAWYRIGENGQKNTFWPELLKMCIPPDAIPIPREDLMSGFFENPKSVFVGWIQKDCATVLLEYKKGESVVYVSFLWMTLTRSTSEEARQDLLQQLRLYRRVLARILKITMAKCLDVSSDDPLITKIMLGASTGYVLDTYTDQPS